MDNSFGNLHVVAFNQIHIRTMIGQTHSIKDKIINLPTRMLRLMLIIDTMHSPIYHTNIGRYTINPINAGYHLKSQTDVTYHQNYELFVPKKLCP